MESFGQANVAAVLIVVLLLVIVVVVVVAVILSQPSGSTGTYPYGTTGDPYSSGYPYGSTGTPGLYPGYDTGIPTGTTGQQGSTGSTGSTGTPPITGSNSWCVPGETRNTGISTAVVEGMTMYQGQSLCRGRLVIKGLTYYVYFGEDEAPGYVTDENGNVIYTADDFENGYTAPGCTDGTREGFLGASRYPNIAGCEGSWTNPDLRATGSGSAESLCASGWHICMRDGSASEISSQVSKWQCLVAGGGAFVAASSHCSSSSGCTYDSLDCKDSGWCSEPICCGMPCELGSCKDALWPGATFIASFTSDGCGNFQSSSASGVLCCKGAGATTGDSDWCTPGGAFDYSWTGWSGYGGYTEGLAQFRGQTLCKGVIYGEYDVQTFFVYSSEDGSVWYITDQYDHVIQSSTGEVDLEWLNQY